MYIAICDDDASEASSIKNLLSEYQTLHLGMVIQVCIFDTPVSLLSHLDGGNSFDLYLLDIILPEMTGIELANALLRRQCGAPVIFLTVSPEYAVEAFRVRARNYLLKPLSAEVLFPALDEICDEFRKKQQECIDIPTDHACVVTVPVSSISYAECIMHRIHYHLADGTVIQSKTIRVPFLQSVEQLLEKYPFIHPHRSYVINLAHVQRLNAGEVILQDGTALPLSRLRYSEIKKAYIHHLSNSRKI